MRTMVVSRVELEALGVWGSEAALREDFPECGWESLRGSLWVEVLFGVLLLSGEREEEGRWVTK